MLFPYVVPKELLRRVFGSRCDYATQNQSDHEIYKLKYWLRLFRIYTVCVRIILRNRILMHQKSRELCENKYNWVMSYSEKSL